MERAAKSAVLSLIQGLVVDEENSLVNINLEHPNLRKAEGQTWLLGVEEQASPANRRHEQN